ncbi:hypothetical protein AVEN_89632-1 [Araneus ventricosus]|uniref:Uncharacterized protein n=1 Tax=Araneus ventricosus TaxID=182803 RepID=A0A4Y2NSN2_ARAVE|nr:hypothetical protein AVEN_89632-1 [Araneus ventricosus]
MAAALLLPLSIGTSSEVYSPSMQIAWRYRQQVFPAIFAGVMRCRGRHFCRWFRSGGDIALWISGTIQYYRESLKVGYVVRTTGLTVVAACILLAPMQAVT